MGLSALAGVVGQVAASELARERAEETYYDVRRKEYVKYSTVKGTFSSRNPGLQNLPKNCRNCGAPNPGSTCEYCLTQRKT